MKFKIIRGFAVFKLPGTLKSSEANISPIMFVGIREKHFCCFNLKIYNNAGKRHFFQLGHVQFIVRHMNIPHYSTSSQYST